MALRSTGGPPSTPICTVAARVARIVVVAEGVLIHESDFVKNNVAVVYGRAGGLLIDPEVHSYERACLANDLYLLAGQVFRSLLGELPLEHSGGLADFDHVAVGVSHVAADLSTAIDRRRDELGPL